MISEVDETVHVHTESVSLGQTF